VLATVGDPESLGHACATLLSAPARRAALVRTGRAVVGRYDWSVVAREVVRVYETTISVASGRVVEDEEPRTPIELPL
jgi:phosphatidylinositol alpha-mannosyltransferase